MESAFFKPVAPPRPRRSMEEEVSPDSNPAGVAPLAALVSIFPRPIRALLQMAINFVMKILLYFGKVLEESFKNIGKDTQQSMHAPREDYSPHTSFDHQMRIERLEAAWAHYQGGFINNLFKKQKEYRIQDLEKKILRKKH